MPLRILAAAIIWLAAVLALGFGWWNDPTNFVRVTGPRSLDFVLVVVATHLIAVTAIVGGALFLLNIAAARMIALSAAICWLAMAAVLGGGMTWPLAIVTALSVVSSIIGFLLPAAHRRRPAKPWSRADASYRDQDRPDPPVDADAVEDHSEPFFPTPSWPVPIIDGPAPAARDRRSRRTLAKGGNRRKSRAREIVAGAFALVVILVGGAFFGYIVWSMADPRANVTDPGALRLSPASKVASASQASVASQLAAKTPVPASAQAALPSIPLAFYPSSAASVGPDISEPSSSASIPATTTVAELPPVRPNSSSSMADSPQATSFATPRDYCASVANIDAPDLAKVSGGVQDLFIKARAAANISQGDVHWRCMDRAVWVCATPTGGLACDKVPTSVDRVLICAAHPDAKGIRTAAGDWSCDGFTPVVTPAQLQAPDRRGFDKDVWHKLADAAG